MRVVQLGFAIALTACVVFGQRPGGFGQRPGAPLGNPLPPLSPIPSVGPIPTFSPQPQFAPQRPMQRGLRSPGYVPLPYYPELPYYPAAYSAPAEPAPGVTIIQQFGPPAAPPPEEKPAVTPQIHEYPAPAAPPSTAAPALFAVVLKDGSELSAAAATVQGSALQIVDGDGEHRRIPLDSVDREATRRRNAERNLRLQLQ